MIEKPSHNTNAGQKPLSLDGLDQRRILRILSNRRSHKKLKDVRKYDQRYQFGVLRRGAKRRGYEWSLSFIDFQKLWQQPCNYCGDDIGTIGLDRMNPEIGYTMANVVSCCWVCNWMKRHLTISQFETHICKISGHLKLITKGEWKRTYGK
jgi:hypothetical protein